MKPSFKRLLILFAVIAPVEILYRLVTEGKVSALNIINIGILVILVDQVMSFFEKRKV